jgi:hypothetical protein
LTQSDLIGLRTFNIEKYKDRHSCGIRTCVVCRRRGDQSARAIEKVVSDYSTPSPFAFSNFRHNANASAPFRMRRRSRLNADSVTNRTINGPTKNGTADHKSRCTICFGGCARHSIASKAIKINGTAITAPVRNITKNRCPCLMRTTRGGET